jgi:hypothetical protein
MGMTPKQVGDAQFLERELRTMAQREKAQYKARTLYDAANLLRDLLQGDDDEVPATDE